MIKKLIAMRNDLGMGHKGDIVITTQERLDKNFPPIAKDIVNETYAMAIVDAYNSVNLPSDLDPPKCLGIEQEEPSNADNLAEAISEAIQTATQLGPDVNEKGVPWNGPHLVSKLMLAVNPQPEDQLSSESLKYHSEKGRNVFDVIAMIAIQLGIEQGLKIYEEDYLEAEIIIRKAKENNDS